MPKQRGGTKERTIINLSSNLFITAKETEKTETWREGNRTRINIKPKEKLRTAIII